MGLALNFVNFKIALKMIYKTPLTWYCIMSEVLCAESIEHH